MLKTIATITSFISLSLASCQNEIVQIVEQKPEQIEGKVVVADWYNFKKAAYSLSFDDALVSQPKYVGPVLYRNNLKATFFILPTNLQADKTQNAIWHFGYWYQYIDLYNQGHEIGSHTINHPDMTTLQDGDPNTEKTLQYELSEPIKKIKEKIPSCNVISFAYPSSIANAHVASETAKYYSSARIGWNQSNPKDPEWMMLKGDIITYTEERTLENDTKKITELQTKIENEIITAGRWGTLIAHDVLPIEEAKTIVGSYNPVSLETFTPFVQWLKAKQEANYLWIAPIGDVTKYRKEKETVKIEYWQKTTSRIELILTDTLENTIYNQPLSLEVTLPSNWTMVVVTTEGISKQKMMVKNGKIRINATPDKGIVVLEKY
jgi:hypothetical protein